MNRPRRRPRTIAAGVFGALLALFLVATWAAPADALPAAGTPNGTSADAAGCAPYWPAVANGGGYICLTNVQAGVAVSNARYTDCVGNGLAYRNTAGTAVGVCVDPGAATDGDIVSLAANSFQIAQGTAICAARGLDASSADGRITCKGVAASAVRDANAGTKLDTIAGKLDTLNTTTGNGQTSSGTAKVTLDTTQYGQLFALLFGALSLLLVLNAVTAGRNAL